MLPSLKIVCGFFSEIFNFVGAHSPHPKAMKANQASIANANYRVALGTCPPFEEGEIITLIDVAIADKNFKDSDGNTVEYGKLFLTFGNGAVLSGSVFRGAHATSTGGRKTTSVVVRSFMAAAMAKAKATASSKYPRPTKGEPDEHAKEFNEAAILSLLQQLTGNENLKVDENVNEVVLKVTSVFTCVGEVGGNTYQYTAYAVDLAE